jgi:mRNA-degrading endonuclease RelE of RelBE toxin-antitoxin system
VYKPWFTQDFRKHFEKLVRKDTQLEQRIKSKIEDMMEDPFRNSQELTAAFKGKRRMYVGKAGYRLIYCICKECKNKKYPERACADCKEKDNDAIVFFDILHRSTAYDQY